MNSRHSRVRSFRANKTSQQNERDGDRRALSLASWTTKAHGALPPLAFVATHSRALCATRAENGESPTRDDRDVCHSLLNFERVVETVSVCDISEHFFRSSKSETGNETEFRVKNGNRKSLTLVGDTRASTSAAEKWGFPPIAPHEYQRPKSAKGAGVSKGVYFLEKRDILSPLARGGGCGREARVRSGESPGLARSR